MTTDKHTTLEKNFYRNIEDIKLSISKLLILFEQQNEILIALYRRLEEKQPTPVQDEAPITTNTKIKALLLKQQQKLNE